MNATRIEYLNFTWSPLVGCSGANCAVYAKCWAKYQAKRQLHKCPLCYEFKPHTHFERLQQPFQVKSSKRIGVCFSADMWDSGFSHEQQSTVLNSVWNAPWHWFINLTKQPQNIPKGWNLPSNWIQGVSVNRKEDLLRIDVLRKTKAPLKMISFEPLYEDLGTPDLAGIDWVIIGAQTHPLILPKTVWVDNLVCASIAKNIPVFMKNNLKDLQRGIVQQYPKLLLQAKEVA